MSDSFASPKRRLMRAKEHAANIESAVKAFFDTEPYAKVVERNARGFDEHKVRLTGIVPDGITDLTYEAIEALRSSLDQAAYAIAVACNSKFIGSVHFPVSDTPANLETVFKRKMNDFPPDILTFFRNLKPYESGDNLIWALNRVCRQSAHRLIVPVCSAPAGGMIHHLSTSGPYPVEVPPPRWDSEKNEIIFLLTGAGAGSDLKYDVEFSFFIAFGQVDGLAGEPVIDTLGDVASEVERIILGMEAEARRIGLIT